MRNGKERYLPLAVREFQNYFSIPLSYRLNTPLVGPTGANILVTARCNSKCSMCSFWKEPRDYSTELTLAEMKGILDQLKAFGVKAVSFSGEGEPLMRPDIINILEYAKGQGFLVSLNTNALRLAEMAPAVAAAAPLFMVIGLDTMDPDTYHKIRGIANGLEKVLEGVARLQAEGYNNIGIGTVILPHNALRLVEFSEKALSQGLKFIRFTAFQYVGFGPEDHTDELSRLRDPAFIRELKTEIEKLISFKQKYGLISNSEAYLRTVPAFYADNKTCPVKCITGYYSIKILPRGEVLLCPLMGARGEIGNTREAPISHLWYSKKAQQVRRLIQDGKCGGCWLSCYAEENLRFSVQYGIQSNLNKMVRGIKLK